MVLYYGRECMKSRLLNAIATLLMCGLVILALPLTVPKLFGYQIFEILTTSMTPVLPVGSAIYVKACDPAQLEPGDIITYKLSSRTGLVETHRVVENDTASQELVTKGDANAQADVYPVGYDRVIGRVEYSIPYWGRMATALRQPSGIAICAAIFALALVLWTVADRGKSKRGNTARQDPAKKA